MHFDVDTLASWSDIFHNLVIPILCYFAYLTREIRNDIRKISERQHVLTTGMQELKQWSVDHDDRDTRHEARTDRLERLAMRTNGGGGIRE